MGRRAPTTPFGQFCERLSRVCLGRVRTQDSTLHTAQPPQAWLEPIRSEDVAHARALCQQYRVALCLDGGGRLQAPNEPTLWVLPQRYGARFWLDDPREGVWRADAGCTVTQLKETALFDGLALAPELTLAQWFAWPAALQSGSLMGSEQPSEQPSEQSSEQPSEQPSGKLGTFNEQNLVQKIDYVGQDVALLIDKVEVLLADGTVEVLGVFGASSQTPLRSLTLQRLVPKLFELASSQTAQLCAQITPWPGRYRLNALMTESGREPNLARLLFGHQGRLCWVQTLWLRRVKVSAGSDLTHTPISGVGLSAQAGRTAVNTRAALRLDQELKNILDPFGVFGSNLDPKELESAS